jgi:hypothetical protein
MAKPYTLQTLIDDLSVLQAIHGDIDVLDGRCYPLHGRHVEVVTVDDWTKATQTEDGEIPGVGHAISIGRSY